MSESDSQWPLRIVIPGKPIGKGRPRFGKGRVYTPKKTLDYEKAVAWTAKAAMGRRRVIDGPVSLTINCFFKGKKVGWHTSKPDWDNTGKLCADALNGIVYLDDRQVSHAIVRKFNGLSDYVEITVWPLSDESSKHVIGD